MQNAERDYNGVYLPKQTSSLEGLWSFSLLNAEQVEASSSDKRRIYQDKVTAEFQHRASGIACESPGPLHVGRNLEVRRYYVRAQRDFIRAMETGLLRLTAS